jgi:hypothetical protein
LRFVRTKTPVIVIIFPGRILKVYRDLVPGGIPVALAAEKEFGFIFYVYL